MWGRPEMHGPAKPQMRMTVAWVASIIKNKPKKKILPSNLPSNKKGTGWTIGSAFKYLKRG